MSCQNSYNNHGWKKGNMLKQVSEIYMFVDPPVCINWEEWSPCSSSCADGIRTRGCKDNPGNATGTEVCNIAPEGKNFYPISY